MEGMLLRGGGSVAIRPIRPEDEAKMARFHRTLSENSVFYRYAGFLKLDARVAHERLSRLCVVDRGREMALVAERDGEIVAVARLVRIPGTADAEFALVVSDEYQRRGLGRAMLQRLFVVGRDWGIDRIVAEILPDNAPMRSLCRQLGFTFYGQTGAARELRSSAGPPVASKEISPHGGPHMRTFALLFSAIAAHAAGAATLTGRIEDPGLRRKTALVYVESASGKFAPPAQAAVMNQVRNTYTPRVLPVIAGQKVEFRSSDPELHNVNARQAKMQLFNQAVLPHQLFTRTMEKPGVVHLSCNVHKEMSADIVVLQNPYFAQPDANGAFTIDGIPAGKYTLRIFGDQLSDEQRARAFPVTVGQGPATLAMR